MVRMRDIIRGAVTRTTPAVFLGFAVMVGSSSYARSQITLTKLGLTLVQALVVATGSSLALLAMRRRLRSDAGVAGRRAFITGLGAFGLAITIRPFLPFVYPAGDYLLMGAAGATLAIGVFFPWLQSREPEDAAIAATAESVGTLGAPAPEITTPHRAGVYRDHDA